MIKPLLLAVLLSGCSSLGSVKQLNSGCDLVCKGCSEIKLKCNQGLDINEDTKTQGTMTGRSIK